MVFSTLPTKKVFYFTVLIKDDVFNRITNLPGAYEIESRNSEIKRINIEEYFTEANYPFTIKLNFSTLSTIIETSTKITSS